MLFVEFETTHDESEGWSMPHFGIYRIPEVLKSLHGVKQENAMAKCVYVKVLVLAHAKWKRRVSLATLGKCPSSVDACR